MGLDLLDQLDQWKSRFGPGRTERLEGLLGLAGKRRLRDAGEAIRLHETLLFLRAHPRSAEVKRLADEALYSFGDRVEALLRAGGDTAAFEEPEVSGIAGTSFTAVFSYEVARSLSARYPRSVEIAWDRYDESDKLGPVAWRFLPLLEEDWPVEAHVPYRDWIEAARGRKTSALGWLLEHVEGLPLTARGRAELYDSLALPLTWIIGGARVSRSRLRLPGGKLYCHSEPLLRRSDVSIERELSAPPLPVRRLTRPEARKILNLILDTSAMRYRELYGFSHPDETDVFHAEAGRGVEIFYFGAPPEWRLPLRAYHAGAFFKNGVPAGYVETLSLLDRAEVGFNLYYTFREGESAWLYARVLRLFRQVLGVTSFSVDPYQIGWHNSEAIDSGAFWFYRKLGFRPVDPAIARLTEREESRMALTPGYRSSPATLNKLAAGYILYEDPGRARGAWDLSRVRNIGLAVQRAMAERFGGDADRMRREATAQATHVLGLKRAGHWPLVLSLIPDLPQWSKEEKAALAAIVRAKQGRSESRYLRLMQRHPRLRATLLELGSDSGAGL